MDIYEKLRTLSWKKQSFFKWENDLEYRKHEPKKTEGEMMAVLQVKTLNEMEKWKLTPEYLEMTQLLLATRFASDLEKSYSACAEKAHDGDSQSIKIMMDLQKFITAANKANKPKKDNTEDAYAELEL